MINKWCHCQKCGNDWKEEDVRIETMGYKATEEEKIRCPKCGKVDNS